MADFKANNTYKKFSRRSNFKEAIYEGRDLSQFASEMGFITPEDNSFVSSQSFNDLNEVAIRSTTNFYIVDDFIDEYFDDVDEFFETYNTGSFSGSFEGTFGGNIENAVTASYALTASTATSVTTAATASYVQASNIDGVIQPRVTTIASSATPTPNANTTDLYIITALATGATFGAPTGTPVQGQKLTIRIEDNGGAQSLAYNAIYRAFGAALPTTTTAGKTLYLGCIYNSTDSAWDVVAVTEQV